MDTRERVAMFDPSVLVGAAIVAHILSWQFVLWGNILLLNEGKTKRKKGDGKRRLHTLHLHDAVPKFVGEELRGPLLEGGPVVQSTWAREMHWSNKMMKMDMNRRDTRRLHLFIMYARKWIRIIIKNNLQKISKMLHVWNKTKHIYLHDNMTHCIYFVS